MPTQLRLYGRPTVLHAGQSIALPNERRCQLLAVLALRRDWVGRSELATLLWPERPSALGLTNVRKALHAARAWPWAAALETQGSAVRFHVDTDVQQLQQAQQEGRLADAVALRCGPLLDGLDDIANAAWTDWLDGERAQHARHWQALSRAFLQQLSPWPDAAAAFARRLLAEDPFDEDAVVALLSAQHIAGRAVEMRETYRTYAERLLEHLGVEPSLRVRLLLREEPVAPRSHDSGTHISLPPDGFVGRARELQDLDALLARTECRLLTVTGPGGAGKSRLVKQALRILSQRFRDGALWIALDDLHQGAQVIARLAAELRLVPGARADPLALICNHLAAREMLLVFDNSEHIQELARLVERLLEAAPALKVCATSRARLGANGEWLLPLHGLATDEATQLFIATAYGLRPDFDAAGQRSAIVALTEALGGLPLAVLLAANWARLLPVAEIAADLSRSLAILESDDEGEERPEHRSVRATFEQSWQMLAPRERQALSALSVFVGPFSRAAAHEVADAAMPLLAALADKSLLQLDGARCTLHPLVRRFAADKLDATAHDDCSRRHAAWYHRRLEQLASAADAGDRAAQQEIEHELENCREAWRWAMLHGALPMLGSSAPVLMRFFEVHGRAAEGLALFEEALPLCVGTSAAAAPAAELHCAIAYMAYRLYRLDDAAASARLGLKLARQAHRRRAMQRCLNVLGLCHWQWGRHLEALRLFEQGLRHARAGHDARAEASMLGNLALAEKSLGHYGRAQALHLDVLQRQRALGDWVGVAIRLNDLAALHQANAEWDTALPYLREGLALCEQHGIAFVRPHLMVNLATVSLFAGKLDDAESVGAQVLADARAEGNRNVENDALLHLVRVAVRRRDLTQARSRLAEAIRAAVAVGTQAQQLDALFCGAEILAADGDVPRAAGLMRFYIARPEVESGDRAVAEKIWAALQCDAEAPTLPLPALLAAFAAVASPPDRQLNA